MYVFWSRRKFEASPGTQIVADAMVRSVSVLTSHKNKHGCPSKGPSNNKARFELFCIIGPFYFTYLPSDLYKIYIWQHPISILCCKSFYFVKTSSISLANSGEPKMVWIRQAGEENSNPSASPDTLYKLGIGEITATCWPSVVRFEMAQGWLKIHPL